MKKIIVLLVGIIILIIGGAIFFVYNSRNTSAPTQKPHLVLTPTPVSQNPGWKTFTDPVQKVSFSYPESLKTIYLHPVTWPPQITISSSPFSCKEGGLIAGQPLIVKKTMGNTTYCIENMSQGAAGTIYSDYTYIFIKNEKLVTLNFSITYPQCENYPQPKMSDCQSERQTFDLDSLIQDIAKTITL